MTEPLSDVTTLVVTVAGFGTRSLPFTKSLPKVMLPLVDKPGVQYIVEEAVRSGTQQVIFITSSNQHSIEDHFDYYWELEEKLRQSKKMDLLREIRRVSDLAHFVYTRQKEQLGNAHAVLQAKPITADKPFCVQFGDDIILPENGGKPYIAQLNEVYRSLNGECDAIISVIETDDAGASKYAIVETEEENGHDRVTSIIEKPGADATTSRLASVTGFLFQPMIFDYIEQLDPTQGKGGEYILADAINAMIKDGRRVYAQRINGRRIDIGSKLDYMKGSVEVALAHPEIKDDFRDWLKQLTL
jgi:UTP--glucose-1-phosphate uridylyltransferase